MTELNKPQHGAAEIRQALVLDPQLRDGHFYLGNLLLQAGRREEAVEAFRAAVRQDLAHRDALIQLGGTLHSLERSTEALVALRTAVALDPKSLPARLVLGTALSATEDYEGAVRQLNTAIELEGRCIPAWLNLGHAFIGLRRYEAAVNAFNQALSLDPHLAPARLNRALAWMAAGDFERGLPDYEWRTKLVATPQEPSIASWNGERLDDGVLLIRSEQGLGDTLQFIRFLPLAKARASQIVLQVQEALLALLKPLEAMWNITMTSSSATPSADRYCQLLSLPLLLNISLANPPASMPYLEIPQRYREKWHGALGHRRTRRIGIAWSGRIRPYENRAIPIAALAPLFDIPDVEWVILQKDITPADRDWLTSNVEASRLRQVSNQLREIADTAAVMEQLDHVVSIDTAIAHLAGVLHKPSTFVLPYAADWRWHADRDRTPWYPCAQLVWQDRPGNWESAVKEVVHQLTSRADAARSPSTAPTALPGI